MTLVDMVFDESGNVGHLDHRLSYAVAGLAFRPAQLPQLLSLDASLGSLLLHRDYKYSHFRESVQAREILHASMRSCDVHLLCFVSHEGGIAAEQGRFDAAASSQPDPDRKRQENLDYFTAFVAQSVNGVAWSLRSSIDVWWDRRSDMRALQRPFEEARDVVNRIDDSGTPLLPPAQMLLDMRKAGIGVAFRGECERRVRPVSRIAGLIAADMLRVFSDNVDAITSRLRRPGRPETEIHVKEFLNYGVFSSHDVAEPYSSQSHLQVHQPAFRAYAFRLCTGRFSFFETTGLIGHVMRLHGRWHIQQLPD